MIEQRIVETGEHYRYKKPAPGPVDYQDSEDRLDDFEFLLSALRGLVTHARVKRLFGRDRLAKLDSILLQAQVELRRMGREIKVPKAS